MMTLARLCLWCAMGALLSSLGADYKSIQFWTALAIIWALESIQWIEFTDDLRRHIKNKKKDLL